LTLTNPVLDQERADFLKVRATEGHIQVPAWPRPGDKKLRLVQLEVGWVRFSTLNHRTKAEQRAETARVGDPHLFTQDPLGRSAQTAQYEILHAQAGFDDLKKDLAERGQQEPAIVTAEGVLINGNRRAAALRSLYEDDNDLHAQYVKCLVLPDDATLSEIIDLETELQIARDFKQGYSWINEAFLIEELFERENKDFSRVAKRMHRPLSDVRTLYDKLQQVHQLVDLSGGARQHIDFTDNEAAFDELAKHIKNKQPAEVEAVRSVYFLGTIAGVPYRKLRLLRRPDAATLVLREIEDDPSLKKLLYVAGADVTDLEPDILDDVLGEIGKTGPITPVLALLATKRADDEVALGDGSSVDVQDLFESLQSAITSAADEANEDQKDQETLSTPIKRVNNAIIEFERALSALPKARSLEGFDEPRLAKRVQHLRDLLDKYRGDKQ